MGGLPIDDIQVINDFATNGLVPDITFIFDIPVEDAALRAGFRSTDKKSSPDRMEQSGEDFFKKTREGYLKIAEEGNRKIFVIQANEEVESIRLQVCSIVDSVINSM